MNIDFFTAFNPHADASLIIEIQFMGRLLNIIPCLWTYWEARVFTLHSNHNTAESLQCVSLAHFLQECLGRSCTLFAVESHTNIWNFIGSRANHIFVKWAVANKTRFVHMAPLVIYNQCKRWTCMQTLHYKIACTTLHGLRSSCTVAGIESIFSARQSTSSLPIIFRTKKNTNTFNKKEYGLHHHVSRWCQTWSKSNQQRRNPPTVDLELEDPFIDSTIATGL